MTAPPRAIEILQHRQDLEYVVDAISDRAEMHDKELDAVEATASRSAFTFWFFSQLTMIQ
jgi:hypothetical protein